MKKLEHFKANLREHFVVSVFITIMAVVYIITMFINKPWYDELYTYYYFISRGPIYAAIHWPVPNNHVGYSVISAFFDFLGNPYIGLRGVSCIAAVANLILLYRLSCRFMNKYFSTAVTALYAGTYLVHRLSVQGRGYTLAVTCYLLAMTAMYNICMGETKRRNYVMFGAMLALGLYIVPSSLYWVVPTCVTGGMYLLIRRNYSDFMKLLLASVCAAFVTLGLYSIIWLAIGANLISKDADSVMYGLHQAKIVLKAPVQSLITGKDYMLATPYIQSIKRSECIRTMPEYFKNLFDNYYSYAGISLMMAGVCVTICSIIYAIRQKFYKRNSFFANMFICVTLLLVPIMLLIQSVQPYLRVLSFYGIPLYFGVVFTIHSFCENFARGRMARRITMVTMFVMILLAIGSLLRPGYREPYAGRENVIEGLFKQVDVSKIDKIFYTDDYTKYVLKFYHDVTPTEVEKIESSDWAVFCPEMYDSKYTDVKWPVLYGYHVARLKYVDNRMTKEAEYEGYTLYQRAGQ